MVVGTACSNETDPTVLPPTLTLHEATGITRNEACLSGKIVLNGEGTVRDCYFVYGSSPEEMIQVGENGVCCEAGDVDRMSRAITELMLNEELRENAGRDSMKIVKAKYSLEAHIEMLERVYEGTME